MKRRWNGQDMPGESIGGILKGRERFMATTTNVPVEVYLRCSYEPDAEYVDGNIEERPQAEFDHAWWQKAIQVWFWQPKEQIVTHPPLAVFEVLSPEDSLQHLKRRLEDYRIMGIPEIWVIDPQDSSFYRYEDRQFCRKDMFSHVEKGITFDMNEIKKLLD
jgi:Uma2 family endonuclease